MKYPFLSSRARKKARLATGALRMLPSLLIIGAQKAGTTSLFKYVARHPQFSEPSRKEIGYFSGRYHLGRYWYRSHFPLSVRRSDRTLEASTGYLDHPLAPLRVARDLPQVQMIVLLRNPVARAVSHYRHSVRLGFEDRSFAEALAVEQDRLASIRPLLDDDPPAFAKLYARYSYRVRGCYAGQLMKWFEYHSRSRFLVIFSEQLRVAPAATMSEVWRFLNLPDFPAPDYPYFNPSDPDEARVMDPALSEELGAFYRPHDERLQELLGKNLPWLGQYDS